MKTLRNHIILYDAECPMCSLYTGAFQKTRMLDADGRTAYQQMPAPVCAMIDRQRAVDEIALVNTQTGEVTYGVHSLFAVIAHSFPVFRPLFNLAPFAWLMEKLYAFVSYNRRVIIPPAMHSPQHAYQPSFKLHYRVAYLLVTCLLTACVLTHYTRLLVPLLPAGNSYREYSICFGQLFFQGSVVTAAANNKTWSYLGNMMTVSFAGALLLLPALLLHAFVMLAPVVYAAWFALVVAAMFAEHARRVHLLSLPWLLSVTWILYRLVVLFFLLW